MKRRSFLKFLGLAPAAPMAAVAAEKIAETLDVIPEPARAIPDPIVSAKDVYWDEATCSMVASRMQCFTVSAPVAVKESVLAQRKLYVSKT